MMKSFFKKLAFVMALAMVVSAMAPAATAKAAEVKTVDICVQNNNYIPEAEYGLTEGDAAKDFCFAGAPDWKNYKWTWSSDNEAVATVDNTGLVTPVAAGEATITVKGGDVYTGTMKLTVNPKEVVPAYVVKQLASDKLTITWADAKEASANVTLYKVFTLTSGEKELVKWPAKVEAKDGVATVVPFVAFDDNADYVLDINGEKCDFTAYVGKITKINVIPKDNGNNGTEIYACAEDPYKPFRFEVEFITDGEVKVDQPAGTSMYYEVIEAADGVEIDSTGEASYITVVGASAVVKAIYYYTDEKGESQQLEDEFVVTGYPVPEKKFDGVLDYAIVAKGTKTADVKWGKTTLINGENGYVALKLADTLKGVSYNGELTLKVDSDPSKSDVAFETTGLGEITYRSSDETKLLVGKYDGKLTAISSDGTAVVIVELTYSIGDGKEETKPVYAFEVDLEPERKAKDVSAKGVTVLVSDDAIAASATITFTVVDQYGDAWTKWTKKEMKSSVKGAPDLSSNITQDIKKDENGKDVLDADGNPVYLNTGKVTINGAAFKEVVKSKSSVTYTLNIADATVPVTISLKNPPVVTGKDEVKTTGFLAEATGTDIDAKAAGIVYATINAYETWTSNGVAYKVRGVAAKDLVVYNDKDFWTKNPTNLATGAVVVMVTKPNGEFVTPTVNASTGAITVPVATANADAELKIEAEGTYNVTLYKVTATTKNEDGTYKINKLPVDDATFAVNNKCTNLTMTLPDGTLSSTANNIKDAVAGLATFKKGDATVTVTGDDIVSVAGVYNDSADKYYVKTITVKNYLENGSYFKQTITLDKIINVPKMPDAQ